MLYLAVWHVPKVDSGHLVQLSTVSDSRVHAKQSCTFDSIHHYRWSACPFLLLVFSCRNTVVQRRLDELGTIDATELIVMRSMLQCCIICSLRSLVTDHSCGMVYMLSSGVRHAVSFTRRSDPSCHAPGSIINPQSLPLEARQCHPFLTDGL